MFREMRKAGQQLSYEETVWILENGSSGVLALLGDEDYPYAVPLSYAYADGKLYFHGAPAGHKMDAALRRSKASFCVVEQDQVVPDAYTTHYRSVIAFGRVRLLQDAAAKQKAMLLLAGKYRPQAAAAQHQRAMECDLPMLAVLEMTIEHLTGKQAAALAKAQRT